MRKLKPISNYLLTYYNDLQIDRLANDILKINQTALKYVVGAPKFGQKVIKYPLLWKHIFNVFYLIYPLLYFVFLCALLSRAVFEKVLTPNVIFQNKRLFLLSDSSIIKTGKRIKLYNNDDFWLMLPWAKNPLIPSARQISVFVLISWAALFKCFYRCIVAFVAVTRRFGYRNTLYMVHAYKWFLFDETLRCGVPEDVELYISNQKDRWAVLFDRLPHRNKIVIQHGTCYCKQCASNIMPPPYFYDAIDDIWILRMAYRTSTISLVYAFTEVEGRAMMFSEMKNRPQFKYIGYNLNLTPLDDPAFSVLIVGYYTYYRDFEEKVLSCLQDAGVVVYLKSHPLIDKSNYDFLRRKYKFNLVEDSVFPKVNLVFSYASTLALEYASFGIEVLYYNQIEFNLLSSQIAARISELKQN